MQFQPAAMCDRCGLIQARQTWKRPGSRAGRYGAQYFYACPCCFHPVVPYSPAAETIVDLSHIGKRIGDRNKPLEVKTLNRIKTGLRKFVLAKLRGTLMPYGFHDSSPFLMQYYSRDSASSAIAEPLPTVTCDNRCNES